jgi:PhzF family phenazine biosynthesis protein
LKIPLYQIDAFTNNVFSGNPAAVCPLEQWLADDLLQSIAAENNLSETAFFVKLDNSFEIRWFTPTMEVNLCGHATLASAYVISRYIEYSNNIIHFHSKSGPLYVEVQDTLFKMNFPTNVPSPSYASKELIAGLGKIPSEVLSSMDYIAVFDLEDDIRNLKPDLEILKRLDHSGVIVTAKGDKADFVSRYFAPKEGIAEDPVTGSAHCSLIPFWSKRLSKNKLYAHQVSPRGGELFCEHIGNRVMIAGRAKIYLKGEIYL